MTERLPTVKEINPYGCLDGNVAANNLYGFNQEQAYELLVENEAHYTEDYLWMGEVAFTYYAQVLLMYVERAERGEHSSFVLHVLDVFQSHFEGDQSGLEYKSEIARSFCMRVLKDFSYYGFGDDDPVFQTPPRILCREVHKLDEVMQKISKDDSLPLMLDSVEASLPKKKSVKISEISG